MSELLKWIAARGKEPSTWAALAPIFGLLGWSIDAETGAAIGAGAAALLGVILKEKGQAKNLIALVALAGLLGMATPLVGCAGQSPADVEAQRARSLDYLNTAYVTATIVAAACVTAEIPPCDKPAVVVGITDAQAVLGVAVDRARATIEAASDLTTMQLALRVALDAVAVYTKAVKVYDLKISS